MPRLASWRTAADEINYRRFFDVNDLAGLRTESADVFDDLHRLVLRLIAEQHVTGLRIDHIDGLWDPAAYLHRLRQAVGRPFYVVVEKVLSRDETLRLDWATAGTTGYNFLNDVNGVFVDAKHVRSLTRTHAALTGRHEAVADVRYESKRVVMATALSSELQVLAAAINRLSERGRRHRDFTFGSIRRALREVFACFPAYRTYVSSEGHGEADVAFLDAAIAAARRRNPAVEPSIFPFLRSVLLPDPANPSRSSTHAERLAVAMKAQQYTAPVQAKGVEDTAFYRYNALLSLNEVGGDPDVFGRSAEVFHRANEHRQANWPHEMNATATHDTKRGEDARARLNVISEIPGEWREAVWAWMRSNRGLRTAVDGSAAPDRGDEYHFYQVLLAVWPPEPSDAPVPDEAPGDVTERLRAYMLKAVREGKVHTSWINPNHAYEAALDAFIVRTLAGDGAQRFLAAFVPFARRLAAAGMINSLSQLVLKLVSPGVPDFYQGTEVWDLSLVDPDNRRLVDYNARREMLASLRPLLGAVDGAAGHGPVDGPAGLLGSWPDGRIKMFVTAAGLRLRRAQADLFRRGAYVPLETEGKRSDHVVACARELGEDVVVAVVPRLVTAGQIGAAARETADPWGDTRVRMPDRWHSLTFRSVLTGAHITPIRTATDAWLMASKAFDVLPVAVLSAGRRAV